MLNRRGRKRKSGVVRDSTNGRSRGERPDRGVMKRNRARELECLGLPIRRPGVDFEGEGGVDPLEPLAGFSLGILRLRGRHCPEDPGGISEEQYLAGDKWVGLVHKHAAIMGYSLGAIKSPGFALFSPGRGTGDDPDPERVAEVRDEWSRCYNALVEHGVSKITYAVCIENVPVNHLSPSDFGALRVGLNALTRVFKIKG